MKKRCVEPGQLARGAYVCCWFSESSLIVSVVAQSFETLGFLIVISSGFASEISPVTMKRNVIRIASLSQLYPVSPVLGSVTLSMSAVRGAKLGFSTVASASTPV